MNTAFLIEDRMDVLTTTSDLLKENGFRVISADGFDKAYNIFRRKASEINVVITDCRLDEEDDENEDGLKLARFIKKASPKTPVIGVSAYDKFKKGYRYFDLFYEKGEPEEENDFFTNIPRIAEKINEFQKEENTKTPKLLLDIKRKYHITNSDFRTLVQNRHLTPSVEKALLAAHVHSDTHSMELSTDDEVQKKYPVVISPEDGAKRSFDINTPFIAIMTQYDEFSMAELYGFPMIYTYGENENIARTELIELLKEYHEELNETESDLNNTPDVVRFSLYLKELFKDS